MHRSIRLAIAAGAAAILFAAAAIAQTASARVSGNVLEPIETGLTITVEFRLAR